MFYLFFFLMMVRLMLFPVNYEVAMLRVNMFPT